MTKLRHESGGHQIDVAPDQVETYETQGWRRVSSAKRAASRATPEPATDDAAPEGDD